MSKCAMTRDDWAAFLSGDSEEATLNLAYHLNFIPN